MYKFWDLCGGHWTTIKSPFSPSAYLRLGLTYFYLCVNFWPILQSPAPISP